MSVIQYVGIGLLVVGVAILIYQLTHGDDGQTNTKWRDVTVQMREGLFVIVLGVGMLVAAPFISGKTAAAGPGPTTAVTITPPPTTPPPTTPPPTSTTSPTSIDKTCSDVLDLDALAPNVTYRVGKSVGVMGTDNWLSDPRQVWVFLTGSDGTVYTYGKPSDRTLTGDKTRHIWASWGAVVGGTGNWTVNVRMLSKAEGDTVTHQAQANGYQVPIPADSDFVADIPVVRNC